MGRIVWNCIVRIRQTLTNIVLNITPFISMWRRYDVLLNINIIIFYMIDVLALLLLNSRKPFGNRIWSVKCLISIFVYNWNIPDPNKIEMCNHLTKILTDFQK